MGRNLLILAIAAFFAVLILLRTQGRKRQALPDNGNITAPADIPDIPAPVHATNPGRASEPSRELEVRALSAYETRCREEFERLSTNSVPELKLWKELYASAGVPESVLYTAIRRTFVAVSERKHHSDLIESELRSLEARQNRVRDSEDLSDAQRQSLDAVHAAASRSTVETMKAQSEETLAKRVQELLEITGLPDRRVIDLAFAITPLQYAPFMPTNSP